MIIEISAERERELEEAIFGDEGFKSGTPRSRVAMAGTRVYAAATSEGVMSGDRTAVRIATYAAGRLVQVLQEMTPPKE